MDVYANYGDTGMTAGRVTADVAQPSVEGDDETTLASCGVEHMGIIGPGEALVGNGVHVVAKRFRHRPGVVGKILVELEPQPGAGSSG